MPVWDDRPAQTFRQFEGLLAMNIQKTENPMEELRLVPPIHTLPYKMLSWVINHIGIVCVYIGTASFLSRKRATDEERNSYTIQRTQIQRSACIKVRCISFERLDCKLSSGSSSGVTLDQTRSSRDPT